MGIAKFDDGIPDNPKHIAAGAQACWLWFCSVLYCRRALTDGFIPKAKVSTLSIGLASPFKHASRLVEVGLWDYAIGGYQVHDYLEWNPSKATVEEYRRKDKVRKHRLNPDRIPDGFHSGSGVESERRGASHAGAKSESESKSEPEDHDFSGESAREGIAPAWRKPAGGLIHGGEQRLHGTHAWCSWPARDGLCVPAFLHREFIGKLGRPDAANELTAWYPVVVKRVESVAIGEDSIVFWRNNFAAWIGSVTARPTNHRQDVTTANLRGLREDLAALDTHDRTALESKS